MWRFALNHQIHRKRQIMINQVDFEGYLTHTWEYREQRSMHLANHRPGENRKTLSDYITV
jgi:hypothetical protein